MHTEFSVKLLDNTCIGSSIITVFRAQRGGLMLKQPCVVCRFPARLQNARTFAGVLTCLLSTFTSLGCVFGNLTAPTPITSVAATANPLVAQYNVTHTHSGLTAWVEFGTDTSYGRQTSVMESSATARVGQTLNILVAGMKPQTTYHMRAHVEWPGGSWLDEDHTFTTGALPNSPAPPQISVMVPNSGGAAGATPAPGIELLSLVSGLEAVATDLQGNIIWFCPGQAVPIKPMQNGHFIMLQQGALVEVDLSCKEFRYVSLSDVNQSLQAAGHSYNLVSFSHDVLTLPNGHWITIIQISQNFTDLPGYPGTTSVLGDLLVDIDPNGNVVWSWSAFDHLDTTRYPYFGMPDWTHSNALVLTADNNLLLSMRAQSWIVKIDYANGTGSGNVLWRLGEDGDFTILAGDPSQWFYAQHYPDILSTSGSQSNIAIYDDGDFRIDPSTGLQCGNAGAPACYTRATIFQIDESTNIATLLWQDLPGYYSFWGGSIDLLSNGDMEFDSSDPFGTNSSQITEATQTDSPQVVWQMNLTGANAYRGYRIPSLYPGVSWSK